ncbi:MAG: aminopeptidase P N-terminal domain-containing protein, partial [Myxococcales bacterium]|nr:aminopeptidase P N-terminal domain-containing protein [Myxococcales bacterium]
PDPQVAVFIRPGDAPLTIFCQARDPEREIWTGYRPGPEGAERDFGADRAFTFDRIEDELPELLVGVRRLHYAFAHDAEHDALVMSCVARARRACRRTAKDVPETFVSPSLVLHELRLRKGADEIAVMREAARVSVAAHRAAMEVAAPGVPEYVVEAALHRVFLEHGSTGPGYTSIVAAGANATCLHYITNRAVLREGQLLLVDAGCEIDHYTADITRTWPVTGRFSPEQLAIYDHVLRAQKKAVAACVEGRSFNDVHDVAIRALTEGMVDIGLLAMSVDEAVETEAYKRFYMHGTSHWLGLDVHDVGSYGRGGQSRLLEAGMVLTVEPGLYVQPDDEEAPECFRGIGVRIEDDILVTPDGPENLTEGAPKEPDALRS